MPLTYAQRQKCMADLSRAAKKGSSKHLWDCFHDPSLPKRTKAHWKRDPKTKRLLRMKGPRGGIYRIFIDSNGRSHRVYLNKGKANAFSVTKKRTTAASVRKPKKGSFTKKRKGTRTQARKHYNHARPPIAPKGLFGSSFLPGFGIGLTLGLGSLLLFDSLTNDQRRNYYAYDEHCGYVREIQVNPFTGRRVYVKRWVCDRPTYDRYHDYKRTYRRMYA